jgi:hypothetical protein
MTRPTAPDTGNACHSPVATVDPAFRLLRPAPADALPIVLDSPHSGTEYPDDFGSVLDDAARHYAEDCFVDRLYANAPMGFFTNRRPAPSLDSVQFDTTEYEYRGEPQAGRQRVWFTAEGDGVGVYLFTLPPDLPRVDSVDGLRSNYGTGVVEIGVLRVCGLPTVQLLSKHPQQPSGMAYVGALTIPFEEFSFVIKVQCGERGTTGLREAVFLDRRLAAGERPVMKDDRMELPGWNPDAAEHDVMFPAHPISRARRVLEHLRRTLVVDPSIARLPGFPLPPPSE